MNKIKNKVKIIVCGFFVAAIATNFAFAEKKIVAVVNSDIITEQDLDDFVVFMRVQLSKGFNPSQVDERIQSMKTDLLDRLIEDRLILQEAKKNKIKVDEKRVKERLDEIKKHYASDKEFENALALQGLVLADMESRIREQLLMYSIVDAKVRSKVAVNPGEITDFYYKNVDQFKSPEQREFESINAPEEAVAKEVYTKLKAGTEVMDLSIQYALQLSKLTARAQGELKKEIEDAVFNLKVGEISQPVHIDDGYYIFRLLKIIPARTEEFSEVQDEIYKFVFNKKLQEEMLKWLDELKKGSYIKIMQQ